MPCCVQTFKIKIKYFIKGLVICTGENSEFGEIFKMMQSEEVRNFIKRNNQNNNDFMVLLLFFYKGT